VKKKSDIYSLTWISCENCTSMSFHTGSCAKETYHIPHPPILMTASAEMHSTKTSHKFSSRKYD